MSHGLAHFPSRPRLPKFSAPDLAPADRVFKFKMAATIHNNNDDDDDDDDDDNNDNNTCKTRTIDKGKVIFYSYSKRMRGLLVIISATN